MHLLLYTHSSLCLHCSLMSVLRRSGNLSQTVNPHTQELYGLCMWAGMHLDLKKHVKNQLTGQSNKCVCTRKSRWRKTHVEYYMATKTQMTGAYTYEWSFTTRNYRRKYEVQSISWNKKATQCWVTLHPQQSIQKLKKPQKIEKDGQLQTEGKFNKPATQQNNTKRTFKNVT